MGRVPQLTVETEASGGSKSTNERGPSLIGSLGSSCRYKRLLSCLGCSCLPPLSPLYTISIYVSPSLSNVGTGQAVMLSRMSLKSEWVSPVLLLIKFVINRIYNELKTDKPAQEHHYCYILLEGGGGIIKDDGQKILSRSSYLCWLTCDRWQTWPC